MRAPRRSSDTWQKSPGKSAGEPLRGTSAYEGQKVGRGARGFSCAPRRSSSQTGQKRR